MFGRVSELPAPLPTHQRLHFARSTHSATVLGSTHIPRSRLAALPPPVPSVPCGRQAGPCKAPGRHAHPPTWAGSGDPGWRSTLNSSASSSTNALGLFLHLPSSRARRCNPGWHRKVSLSHLRAAWPAPSPARSNRGAARLPWALDSRGARGPRCATGPQTRPPGARWGLASRRRRDGLQQEAALPLSSSSPSSLALPPCVSRRYR